MARCRPSNPTRRHRHSRFRHERLTSRPAISFSHDIWGCGYLRRGRVAGNWRSYPNGWQLWRQRHCVELGRHHLRHWCLYGVQGVVLWHLRPSRQHRYDHEYVVRTRGADNRSATKHEFYIKLNQQLTQLVCFKLAITIIVYLSLSF